MAETLKEEIIEEIKNNLSLSIDDKYEHDYGRGYTVVTIKLMYGKDVLSHESFTIDHP